MRVKPGVGWKLHLLVALPRWRLCFSPTTSGAIRRAVKSASTMLRFRGRQVAPNHFWRRCSSRYRTGTGICASKSLSLRRRGVLSGGRDYRLRQPKIRCVSLSVAKNELRSGRAVRNRLLYVDTRAVPGQMQGDVSARFFAVRMFERIYDEHRHGLCGDQKSHRVGDSAPRLSSCIPADQNMVSDRPPFPVVRHDEKRRPLARVGFVRATYRPGVHSARGDRQRPSRNGES